MANGRDRLLRIGKVAARAGVTPDTVRYYERRGLIRPLARSGGGYRLYSETELGRLIFIRRARRLGLSLREVRDLLEVAEHGDCQTLRRRLAELLRQKLAECQAKLAELQAFKAELETRYRLALEGQGRPACECASFPASCACLPVSSEEL